MARRVRPDITMLFAVANSAMWSHRDPFDRIHDKAVEAKQLCGELTIKRPAVPADAAEPRGF